MGSPMPVNIFVGPFRCIGLFNHRNVVTVVSFIFLPRVPRPPDHTPRLHPKDIHGNPTIQPHLQEVRPQEDADGTVLERFAPARERIAKREMGARARCDG